MEGGLARRAAGLSAAGLINVEARALNRRQGHASVDRYRLAQQRTQQLSEFLRFALPRARQRLHSPDAPLSFSSAERAVRPRRP
jgi:hypothetical protein